MKIATTGPKTYALLPSGILIVDPDKNLLAARALLLAAAEGYVAASGEEIAGYALRSMDLRIAILSQTLGQLTLERLAQEIRLYWPNAFILLVGNARITLEDWLYDDSINEHCRPEQLLSILHGLKKRGKHRAPTPRSRIDVLPFFLSRSGWMLLHSTPRESDPSKETVSGSEGRPMGWDVPANEHAQSSSKD